MSTDRDTTRIVRSWLKTDEYESADRVLDAVLDRIDTTPQRRATWWPARRFQTMNSTIKYGLAAGVVAIAALLGFSYFVAPNIGSIGLGEPTPSPSPSPSPVPSPLSGQDPLSAGRYQVDPALPMDVTIEVPAGWQATGNWQVTGPDGLNAPAGHSLGFWSVENLVEDPLSPGYFGLDPRVGPTVDDLADALVNHPAWTATGPTDVTADGHAGKLVELTVPAGIDFDGTSCAPGGFVIWQDVGGGYRCAQTSGQTLMIYIIDVDGERLVFDAVSFPETRAADLTALQGVVDSIRISP